MVDTKNIKCEELKADVELMNKHLNNKDLFWASMMQAKIENKYNVKIVANTGE